MGQYQSYQKCGMSLESLHVKSVSNFIAVALPCNKKGRTQTITIYTND